MFFRFSLYDHLFLQLLRHPGACDQKCACLFLSRQFCSMCFEAPLSSKCSVSLYLLNDVTLLHGRTCSVPINISYSGILVHFSFYFFFCILSLLLLLLLLLLFFYCSGFCHTLKWNSHGFTCVPHLDPPSHLPLHPIPLGLPSAPGLSACLMHPTWAGDLFHPW